MNSKTWKYSFILLFGIGLSNIGAWIYLIALNLIVLDKTGSALAVAALYMISPISALFTNWWAGSLIDRSNKRRIMIGLDLVRAFILLFLPFCSSMWQIYSIVFLVNIANSLFRPSSMVYIAKLIPKGDRKRFNSLLSFIQSGAFLIGPAIAGLLFMMGTPSFAIYINAAAFLLSGLLTVLMPDVEKGEVTGAAVKKSAYSTLIEDWKTVIFFSRHHKYVMVVYLLFSFIMIVMASALDSLEAVFAKEVLSLSNEEYGFLVSAAGAGIIAGAAVNALFVKKIPTSLSIGLGAVVMALGYMGYSLSGSFPAAALSFFFLAFSIAFANTGFMTFYQFNIPSEYMGRITSAYGLLEAGLIVIAVFTLGAAAQLVSTAAAVLAGSVVMLCAALFLCGICLLPSESFHNIKSSINESR
ncbi:MFS transporter [Bacillus lacus]|uniref:MFS transporter n=1 Tax=Metabacillus lacus TaxID=1983721 RepID=A0A7X2J258_9BACI|nr:MFS transporter [Metabacillus lacus]MRX73273.1 MFS transporter [Metabacillus lacus]